MPEWSNEEIDDLFRRGSERYPFTFNPEAWRRMEHMLRRRRRCIFWWWFFGLGFLLLLGWFFWLRPPGPDNGGDRDAQRAPVQATEPYRPGHEGTEGLQSPALTAAEGTSTMPGRLSAAANPSPGQGGKNPGEIPVVIGNVPAPPQQGAGLTRKKKHDALTGTLPPDPVPERFAGMPEVPVTEAPPETDHLAGAGTRETSSTLPEKPASFFRGILLEPLAGYIRPLPWQLGKTAAIDLFPATEETTKKRNVKPGEGIFLALHFSPEFSSTFHKAPGLGRKWGLGLEWKSMDHYSLEIGVLASRKNYQAGKGEYTPPKGFWTRRIAPVATDANCTVLEIPILFSYYFRPHHRSGWFGSLGMSSYLMLEEHYHYAYDLPDDDLIRYWGAENENQHWMSIVDLSMGYQWAVRPGFRLELSPFMQIPLGGVGHGKVRLYSMGLQVRTKLGLMRF